MQNRSYGGKDMLLRLLREGLVVYADELRRTFTYSEIVICVEAA